MKYIIAYWHNDLSSITKLKRNDVIDDNQMLELLHNRDVNVMVEHYQHCDTNEDVNLCWIDNKRFRQR